MNDKLLRLSSLLLFPLAAWQVWITDIPNYHLQHPLMWLLPPFLAWAWWRGLWRMADARALARPFLPFLALLVPLQAAACRQSAHLLTPGDELTFTVRSLVKLVAQWPFLLVFCLVGLLLTRDKACRTALLRGAIALFLFIFLLFLLQALFVYLRSPDGTAYTTDNLPGDPLAQAILDIVRRPLHFLASFLEARWGNGVYDFYHGGAYALTLPRINAVFEEASMLASHIGVFFFPLAVGLLGRARLSGDRRRKRLARLMFAGCCLMLAACRSTTGQLLLIVAVIIWFCLHIERQRLYSILSCGLLALACILGMLLFIPQGYTSLLVRMDGYLSSAAPRAVVTRASLPILAESPLLGVGRDAYLPLLYQQKDYRDHIADPELALWEKSATGEMSALLAFASRYGIPCTLLLLCGAGWLCLRLHRLRDRFPRSESLAFAAAACPAWLVMGIVTLLGLYDPRNALFLLPGACFLGISLHWSARRRRERAGCCIIMHSFGGGGEKMALLLAEELARHGRKVGIACLSHQPLLPRAVPDGVAFSMPARPGALSRLLFLPRVEKLTAEAAVVVGSLELQSMLGAALLAPGRTVGWLHKDVAGYLDGKSRAYRPLYLSLMALAIRRSRTVVCVSDGILHSSRALWPRLASRFQRIHNPMNLPAVRERSLLPLPPEVARFMARGPVILAVGRLERQKNFSLLLEAHALLRKRGLPVCCCIVGEGSERPLLAQKIRELGTAESVLMPGFLNPYPLMRQATVLALSSLYEGLSLVIIEALALDLPVVAVNCPSGPAEVLQNGRVGLLVEGTATALADGLETSIALGRTGESSRLRLLRADDFSLEKLFPAWLRVLEDGEKGLTDSAPSGMMKYVI